MVTKAEEIKETITKKVSEAKHTKKASPAKKSEESDAKVSIVLQYGDKNVAYDDLVQNAKNKFQYDMNGNAEAVKEISLYVKPEENKVYFVMDNDVSGDYDL